MNAPAFTPGPWTYFVGPADGRGLIRIETAHDANPAGIHVASMPRGRSSKANAALIAAAPQLYEAAAAVAALYADEPEDELDPAWGALRAALAKAVQS